MNNRLQVFKIALVCTMYALLMGYSGTTFSQSTPVVSVRFANPAYNCTDSTYCLDVEFRSDTLGTQLFGMNIRFFYSDTIMELDTIWDFQGGYEAVDPDPPMLLTGMGAFLNFPDSAEWVNGAMQLKNTNLPPIFLDTLNWTYLFQVCFTVDEPYPDFQNFCPPVVWDLQVDPANGGYLGGDDGVVITIVDPSMNMESIPSDENVVQFNWMYTTGTPYFGTPIATDCISLDCSPMLICAVDTTIECDESTDPAITGFATATDICDGDPVITFSDSLVAGSCPNNFILIRTWFAENACNLFDTCVQIITVIDTTSPTILCPPDAFLQCAFEVPPPNPGIVSASDNCSGPATITFVGDVISNVSCINRFIITRTYRATDVCGNSATCNQTLTVFDNTPPAITCPTDITVQCAGQVPPANPASVTTSDNCGGAASVTFIGDVISNSICVNRFIVSRTYQSADECGNTATCVQTITVFDDTPPFILCPGNITVQCASQVPAANIASVVTSDNCGGAATVNFASDVISNQTCVNRFNITRTYTSTDDCGNSASCAQTIIVFDNIPPAITCPVNTTVQCANQIPAPDPLSVSATDNCNGVASVSFVNDVITNQSCTNRFDVIRTYSASDECGNSATCSQTITVFDNIAPVIVCPPDVTVQCANQVPAPNTSVVLASDNCNGVASVFFVNDVISSLTCVNRFNITRTYRAVDECGNSATCSQHIEVFDNIPPSITCPANTTVQCASLVPAPNPAVVIASDNCNGIANITFVNDMILNQTCTNRFDVIRTYRATDECGNSATCSQAITVFDNTVPQILCPANVTVQCASLVPAPNTATVIASDNCNGITSVTFVDDVVTGLICINRFNVTRTYRATDECGNSATCSQTITVFDNTPPSISCPGNTTVQCASLVPAPNPATVIASDNCNGVATVTFVSDVINNQTCVNRFNIIRTYRAVDECGNSASCSQTITIFDNTSPSITCPVNVTVQCASLVPAPNPASVIASDNCNGLASASFVNDIITNQTCTNRFNVIRTYRATDECGNSATCSQTITVFDNTAPSINCPANTTVQCASQVPAPNPGSIIASDNCNGLASVTFVNDVIANQTCTNRFNVVRTYRATDECGNSATCSHTITVFDNTPPSIICPVNTTVQCASQVPVPNPGSVIASDNCNGLATVIFVNDVITNQTCNNRFDVTRTYRATDECGNSATCSQTITVFDNTPPSILCPANTTVQCANQVPAPNPGSVTATDLCSAATTITFVNDIISNQTCVNRFTITRTYNAVDECGNSGTCSQTITVFDNTPPSITCPGNTTVQCASQVPVPNPGLVISSDNCNGLATVTFVNDVITNQTCLNRFNVIRTYIAVDECGNSASCSQTISVFDNIPPSIACPVNVTVQCANMVPAVNTASVSATDNCGGAASVTFVNDVISNQTCINRFTLTRTYRATDECGNSATCSQTITIFDNIAPTILCPGNVTVQCASQVPPVSTASVITSDNCGGAASVTFTGDVISNQICTNQFTVTRTYVATDECGNSASCNQIITVFDNSTPSITCPTNITVQCASQVPAANPASIITTDNCGGVVTVTTIGPDVISNQTCTNRFILTRTYRATDACGNSATCAQTITVFDNSTPSITCPTNITVQCASLVPAANPASVITSDNCGGIATVTTAGPDVITNQTCANRFTITRTYRSTDECGNSATCSQTITVNDNTAPAITCPANMTVAFGASTLPANTGNPTGADNCTGAPVFTSSDVVIQGNCPEDFTINRTWTATDVCGNSATCLQAIFVDGNCLVDLSLVKILNPNQGTVEGGDNISFTITVTNDGQGDVSSVTITDYIPIGFTLNDPDWTPGNVGSTGQSASIVLSIANGGLDANGLNPGENVSVQITLQADANIQPGQYFNSAEISVVLNLQGVDVSDDDVDSDADADDTNDPPGEDDFSQAPICVLPQPVIVGDPFVCPSQLVTYTVQNYNPAFTYNWSLNGGGTIVGNTGETIAIQWLSVPGTFEIQLTVVIFQGCEATTFLNVVIEDFEVLACDDHIQISLDGTCQVVITPSMILEGQLYGENYIVILLDENGDTIPNATLTFESVGHTFTVKIMSECGINSCWGTISVEDKIAPNITCGCQSGKGGAPPGCEITCLEIDQLADGIIPVELQPDVTDNCGQVTVEIVDIDVNADNCAGGFVSVTWLATDLSGNTATCVEVFTVIPLTLDGLVFPPNFIGSCGTSINPSITGWPTLNGVNLTDAGGVCNIFAGYWDEELNECGGGRKIIRTWTVLDWCTVEIIEYTQVIKLIDDEGPIITCPSNLTVGTDFWYCYANVSVPKPQAFDVCSDVVNFSLSVNGGTVVHFGNNFVINGLVIGTYPVIWTVTDECGNSSTCSFTITVHDDVVPVANCDQHTIVALTNDGPSGVTLVPASVFDDGSYDNCGPVTFRVRRMDSCIDFD
ncbi:MAG TPA: hypothetical protein VFG10_00685, partial [Saprospiraceae bacterium]|nr:hypothetical protein [Saprospiraceae bacterium]